MLGARDDPEPPHVGKLVSAPPPPNGEARRDHQAHCEAKDAEPSYAEPSPERRAGCPKLTCTLP